MKNKKRPFYESTTCACARRPPKKCLRGPGTNSDVLHSGIFFIATIAAISGEWFPYDCNDRCDRWYRTEVYLCDRCRNDRYDRCNRWRVVSIWSQRSLNLVLAIAAIVAIIWKLVVVRITQLFCSDRNGHMETSLYIKFYPFPDIPMVRYFFLTFSNPLQDQMWNFV